MDDSRATLDEQTRRFLDMLALQRPQTPPDLAVLRDYERRFTMPMPGARAQVERSEDRVIPGPDGELPVRIFRPRDPCGGTLVFFHGGGYVLGTIDGYDPLCSALCGASGCVVVSVGYRLAPEHKFPAAILDAYAATEWASAHAGELGGDAARLAVGGDSAGGNLAANVALMARDRGGPAIAYQLLIYPTTHGRTRVPSQDEFADGYFLTAEMMSWFAVQYLDGAGPYPYGAPFDAEDHHGLPPALILTAGFDPLRDQGAEYAAKLRDAGVAVEYVCTPGTIHGFLVFAAAIDKGREAITQCAGSLRRALG